MLNLIYGMQWVLISAMAIAIWGGICLSILIGIQTIVYRTTKISIYKILMKSLLK